MKIGPHDIGVCSWSLREQETAAMIAAVRKLGLSHCQLALTPLILADEAERVRRLEILKPCGLAWTAGMISFPGEDYSSIAAIRRSGGFVQDAEWDRRRGIAEQAIPIAQSLGIKQISTHVGFIPPSNDEHYALMVQRVGEIAQQWARAEVELLMETGQEQATELLQFLNDLPTRNVGVNFDPANMILYGAGDFLDAISILREHISHVHIKDAVASQQPGVEWGSEVPFGTGEVDPPQFLAALSAAGYEGALTIEREGRAKNPIADIEAAIRTLHGAQQ